MICIIKENINLRFLLHEPFMLCGIMAKLRLVFLFCLCFLVLPAGEHEHPVQVHRCLRLTEMLMLLPVAACRPQ